MTHTIGFIGTGRIAEPMVRSLQRRFPDTRILITARSQDISGRLEQLQNVDIKDNQEILDNSDVIFLSVLASVAREILPSLRFKPEQTVISVMADISLAEISRLIAPATRLAVTIPLPFIQDGGCPLPVYPDSEALRELFGDDNEIILCSSESALGPHFAATAMLSHTMKQLDTVAQWLSQYNGSRPDAERYAVTLLSGYLNSLPKDGNGRLQQAMDDLSTEGGLNNQLRQHIGESGFYQNLQTGLDQLQDRLSRNAG